MITVVADAVGKHLPEANRSTFTALQEQRTYPTKLGNCNQRQPAQTIKCSKHCLPPATWRYSEWGEVSSRRRRHHHHHRRSRVVHVVFCSLCFTFACERMRTFYNLHLFLFQPVFSAPRAAAPERARPAWRRASTRRAANCVRRLTGAGASGRSRFGKDAPCNRAACGGRASGAR